jgi:predicted ATPase
VNGHRLVGTSLLLTGSIAEGRAHLDQGITLSDLTDHHGLTHLGADARIVMLGFRALAFWLLGFPEAGISDADNALREARDIAPVGTLMHTLSWGILTRTVCGHAVSSTLVDELVALADDKSAVQWKTIGTLLQAILTMNGQGSEALHVLSSRIAAYRSTGSTFCLPWYLANLATAYANIGHIEEARGGIAEAVTMIETDKERWFAAEINRMAGEIELKSPQTGAAKAEAYFERALAVARSQKAKSWELRAAMSLARLWRDQEKRDEAREVLAPVYGWFTEGFDTRDLKEAKALLEE